MRTRPLLTLAALLVTWALGAQPADVMTVRTIDGSHNNLDNPTWGAAGDLLRTVVPLAYSDSISSPAGANRPNPRVISNALFAQNGLISDPLGLSDFCWVWGQFIDHDIGLTPDGNEPMIIQVPTGDPWFDPNGQGQAIIPMMRNLFDPATGTSVDNPRRHPNIITAFVDASSVYGSDNERASWLRTFEGGKLKISAGNMLPFNTTTGEFDDPIDPTSPHMDNPVGLTDKIYVAGDARANENPLLLGFHTLFVRQHNLLCDQLAEEHPDWDDEQLYQHARRLVGGLVQSIVYDEWLPAMGVVLPPYTGYDPGVNPQMMNVFTAAAFRLGHTLLNGMLQRRDNQGNVIPQGNLQLRDAFFNPLVVQETGGLDPFFKGMAVQTQQEFDAKVIDDVRNFLFGAPGAGGLDLASININRGRERGLADFNTVRETFGLPRLDYFQQINPNPAVFSILLMNYADIDNIDPWVGLLSEKRMPGALFGETVMKIMEAQFLALRDGDRFYYENDPVLTAEEKDWIRNTTLHDVIMKTTGIILMQNEVFKSMPHEEICDNLTVDVSGHVRTEVGQPVTDVYAALQIGTAYDEAFTDNNGAFVFAPAPGCQVNGLSLYRDDNASAGVTTLDLIIVQKHILGIQSINSPYKMIAADVDKSAHISTFDLIRMRRVILGLDDVFQGNTSWRFVQANYDFPDPSDPWAESFPEAMDFDLLGADLDVDFIGIKVGDVNGSVTPNGLQVAGEVDDRHLPGAWSLHTADQLLTAGHSYEVAIHADDLSRIEGYQFGLAFDTDALTLIDIVPGALAGMTENNFGRFAEEGLMTTSWHAVRERQPVDGPLFTLILQARRDGLLSQWLHLNGDKTAPAAYNAEQQALPVTFAFDGVEPVAGFELLQNRPNPFAETTVIPFRLPEAGTATLTVYDLSGRALLTRTGAFDRGYNEWTLGRHDLRGSAGILYYRLETAGGALTRKMLRQE